MELIKRKEGFYVPREYDYWSDTGKERREGHREDCCAYIPDISFGKEADKWKLGFCGADSGGYDTQGFQCYFDTLKDLLVFIGLKHFTTQVN